MRLNKFDEARKCFSMAIDLAPNEGRLYFHRGLMLFNLNIDIESACQDMRRAYSLGYSKVVAQKLIKQYCK
jgi:tetratricopeptide (TPR) repeat protein